MAVDFRKAKGSQLLKDVAAKNSVLSNGTLVVHLEIDKLHDNPDNKYLFGMEETDIQHTAEGIKRNGFHGAIEVFDTGEGFYEIYSGHIRKYGAMKAGMDKIPCIISPMPEPAQKRRLLVGANLYGRNKVKGSNPIYTGRQLVYHKETLKMEGFKGDIREQLAKEFGISGSQAFRYMALTEMIEQLQEITGMGLVPFTVIHTAKSYPVEKQEELYGYIMEKAGPDLEPLTKSELKECFYKIHGEQPMPGQMELKDYRIETEHIESSVTSPALTKEAMDEECTDCMLNNNSEAGILECHPENGEHKCLLDYDENESASEEVVHGEQNQFPSSLPSIAEVFKAYETMGHRTKEIKNYYKLREHLINDYGKSHCFCGYNDIDYRCSLRGIKINSNDEITWTMFLDMLYTRVPLDMTKQEGQITTPVPAVKAGEKEATRVERMIYEVERQLSNDTTDSIPWSRPEEALKVLRSLVAMLEDEIEAIS